MEYFRFVLTSLKKPLKPDKMKNYFKGQKTKIGTLLRRYYKVRKIKTVKEGWKWVQDWNTERGVELMLYGTDDGEFWGFEDIEFADKKGNPCWDSFNKQIARIIKENSDSTPIKNPIGKIDLRHPCSDYEWDQFTIWNRETK